jgi:hypothetical protein
MAQNLTREDSREKMMMLFFASVMDKLDNDQFQSN